MFHLPEIDDDAIGMGTAAVLLLRCISASLQSSVLLALLQDLMAPDRVLIGGKDTESGRAAIATLAG